MRVLLPVLLCVITAATAQESSRPTFQATTPEILGDTMGVDFGPYLAAVLKDVRKNWYELIPPVARPPQWKTGQVAIDFAIQRDGHLTGMRVTGPSGDVALDRAAWGGITASSPFPPLPSDFRGSSLVLRLHFYYNPEKPGAYARAMYDVTVPETRERAAADLIAYAHLHGEVANHVAYVLAAQNTHLDDAEKLGSASVLVSEQASAAINLEHFTSGDLLLMNELAEHWDALGAVRLARGEKDSAKRYCRTAWELGGEGPYLQRVARLAMQEDEPETARHMLQVALSGEATAYDKRQIREDLAKLGIDQPQAIPEPTTVILPNPSAAEGAAEFWLLFAADHPPQVKWAGGDKELAAQGSAIAAAKYPPQMPDAGPEHVLRRVLLACRGTTCKLTLLYSYQAIPASGLKTQ
jgi:TonB family protein